MVYKQRGMMILCLVRPAGAGVKVRHHDFRGERNGRITKMMSNNSDFEKKSCQEWLQELRLFGLEKRRPMKGEINGLKILEGLSYRPRIRGQGNTF